MHLSPQKYAHLSDTELLNLYYTKRNNKWLGILLSRYTLLLLGVCMKYLKNEQDAQDAVQQVFIKALNEVDKYEIAFFKSWIYMVAKNHCLMTIRKNKFQQVEVKEQMMSTTPHEDEKEVKLQKEELLSKMEIGIKQLNEEQRRCIELFYLEKKSYATIAEETGFTMLQVKSHLQNGKRNLKLLIQANDKRDLNDI